MCWPQPAQVVLPHFLQVTARHTVVLLRGWCLLRDGWRQVSAGSAREARSLGIVEGIVDCDDLASSG